LQRVAPGGAEMKRRDFIKSGTALAGFSMFGFNAKHALGQEIHWQRESSIWGELPVPSTSREQTGDVIGRFDKDSPATDFVLSYRVCGPALVWYRRMPSGRWDRYIVENEFVPLEAGGTAFDVDGDGNIDIIFGEDHDGNKVYWWENPYPNFDPDVPWKRHIIKDGGANQHHDMIVADVEGTGKPQLYFWNQGAKTLFMGRIPEDPCNSGPWPLTPIYSGAAGEGNASSWGWTPYAEGMDAYDIDGDGKLDLLAGNFWFKYEGNDKFKPIKVGVIGGRIRAGRFKPGKYPQIVIAPGDGNGPLMLYECVGNPEVEGAWVGHRLLDEDMKHGHTLDIADIDGDGNLDILTGEQGKWTTEPTVLDNPEARAWILYGNGDGTFRTTVLDQGEGWHDGKIADFDGDGDLDLLQKPYAWSAPRVDVWLKNGTGYVRSWKPKTAATVKPHLFDHALGMELWTYRRLLSRDTPGTLGRIGKLGFRDIETASFYGRSADEFADLLKKYELTCSSVIAEFDRFLNDLDGVIRDAKTLGAGYVITSNIPRPGELTTEEVHAAAAIFNDWGIKVKKEGLQFGYHPHGFEFVHTPKETLFDVLLKETNPEFVMFELDTFWFVHGGADPVCYLEKYPGRFDLMHLKDMAKGTATDLTGHAPDEASVALGKGELDWPAILHAADRSGVKAYFIEDESPSAPEQVLETKAFLEHLSY
jgi:sugar phosphate isomerase/epimerase